MIPGQLWNKFVNGDEQAFQKVVEGMRPVVFAYILGHVKHIQTAEDIEQDFWVKLYLKREPVTNLLPYFFKVAFHMVIDHQRKRKILPIEPDKIEIEVSPTVDHTFDQDHLNSKLRIQLNELDYKIWTMHIEGYKNDEIAKQLSTSSKTVANRKSIIKSKLEEYWKDEMD